MASRLELDEYHGLAGDIGPPSATHHFCRYVHVHCRVSVPFACMPRTDSSDGFRGPLIHLVTATVLTKPKAQSQKLHFQKIFCRYVKVSPVGFLLAELTSSQLFM